MATRENPPDRTGPPRPAPEQGASADELEADIERTREELGETVEALAGKLDVKARAQQRFATTKEQALTQAGVARARATELSALANARATELSARAKDNATDEQGQLKPAVRAVAAATLVIVAVVIVTARRRGRGRRRGHRIDEPSPLTAS
jgi:hypothetical protein